MTNIRHMYDNNVLFHIVLSHVFSTGHILTILAMNQRIVDLKVFN